MEILNQHFYPDKYQHYGNTLLQIGKLIYRPFQQKEKRAQPEHRENIGGVNHQYVARAEINFRIIAHKRNHRGDTIEGKNNIGSCQHYHHHGKAGKE